MVKFPEPPTAAALGCVEADVREFSAGTELWRLYYRGGRHPTLWDRFRAFGPLGSRFDHHLSPLDSLDPPPQNQRAVLYCAVHGPTCVAEFFQETRFIDREARKPWLVGFALESAVRLLDLTGNWAIRAGASMAIACGPRPRSQRWSRAIYEAYPDLDGLIYPSSMNANRPAIMLYERGRMALPAAPIFHRPLLDPALLSALKTLAAELGYGLS